MEGISIDELVSTKEIEIPDFIKLDIHGSEYEAICGAEKCLKNKTIGLLVESWLIPVHKGQKLHSHVEQKLNELGFYAIDQRCIARWKLKSDLPERMSARQKVVLETLYFKDISLINSMDQMIKSVFISQLFGQSDLAYQYCKKIQKEESTVGTELLTILRKNTAASPLKDKIASSIYKISEDYLSSI